MAVVSAELRAWLVPGLAGTLAVVDDDGRPEITRSWAVRPGTRPDTVEIYVQRAASERLLRTLARGPRRGALNVIEVATYRSRAFKGECALAGAAIDVLFLDECVVESSRVFHAVGMPVDAADRLLSHAERPREMVAVLLDVDAVFDQSPKPGAGERL